MSRRTAIIAVLLGVILLSAIGAGTIWMIPSLRWRAELVVMKATGQISGMSCSELLPMLRPKARYGANVVVETGNPYTLRNPYTSAKDIETGRGLFRERCSLCHGADGTGATGPSLVTGQFRNGSSDWGLYLTIRDGVPGSAMAPHSLPPHELWKLVSFVKSIGQTAATDSGNPTNNPAVDVNVPFERLLGAQKEPENWLTYSGAYDGHRFSSLRMLDRTNVDRLGIQWVYQLPQQSALLESSPLVVDGIMFLTTPPNDVLALDARNGNVLWSYHRPISNDLPLCCGHVNRGLAILDGAVYLATLDAHLVA